MSSHDGSRALWLGQVEGGPLRKVSESTISMSIHTRPGGFTPDGLNVWVKGPPPGTDRMRMIPLDGSPPRPFLGATANTVEWSPDGTQLAYFASDSGDPISIAAGDGRSPRQIFVDHAGQHSHFPTWSADAQWIYWVSGNMTTMQTDLMRLPVAGGTAERLTEHNSWVSHPTPLDDRTVLYVAEDEHGGPWLWAYDVPTRSTRRVSSGLDHFTSLAATADRRRLVASVSAPTANLYRVPISGHAATERDVVAYAIPSVHARAPRAAAGSVHYLSSDGGTDALWRVNDAGATSLYRSVDAAVREPPAISADGRLAALVVRLGGHPEIRIITLDGSAAPRTLTTVAVQGGVAWSPDSKWLAAGGAMGTDIGLYKIPVDGGGPIKLVEGAAYNPAWSSKTDVIVYSSANVANVQPVRAVRADGQPFDMPELVAHGERSRVRFLPDGSGLLYVGRRGVSADVWVFEFATGRSRPLTAFTDPGTIEAYDLSPDGKWLLFDRIRDNADVVLIDLAK